MPRIFVSYSRVDEAFASQLAASLAEMGADVWIDLEDIPAGMKWSSAIQEGLDSANLLIVIISPDSMASRNVEDEWHYYLDNGKPIIPILLQQAKVHFQLSRIQYIDFLNQPYDRALAQLHAELGRKGVPLAPPKVEQPARTTTPAPPTVNMSPASRPAEAKPTSHPPLMPQQPRPTMKSTGSNRNLMIGGAVVGLAVIAVIAFLLLTSNRGEANNQDTATFLTQTAAALVAQNPTANPTDIPTDNSTDIPSATLTNPPTRTSEPTRVAWRGVHTAITSNADWTPIERTINGVTMVLVPRGTLRLGASAATYQRNMDYCSSYPGFSRSVCQNLLSDEFDDKGQQSIEMPPYWIDKYEVSNRLYHGSGDDLPVVNVHWYEGQNHCASRDSYTRLPTEPEWEYAAKGPSDWRFPWGNDVDSGTARANICDSACTLRDASGWRLSTYRDGHDGTAPVTALDSGASWVGALNMAGNVWEYTSSIYHNYPYRDSNEDLSDRSGKRTLRGSSWNWVLFEATTTSRADHYGGGPTSDFYGFRCMREFQEGDFERFGG